MLARAGAAPASSRTAMLRTPGGTEAAAERSWAGFTWLPTTKKTTEALGTVSARVRARSTARSPNCRAISPTPTG